MKLYAEIPARRLLQIAGDLGLVLWIWLTVQVGRRVHALVLALADPGRRLEEAGGQVAVAAARAAERAEDVPLVGDALAGSFGALADAAGQLAAVGAAQQATAATAAVVLGLALAVPPAAIVLLLWLWRRARWVREATAAARLRGHPGGLRLLALRALATLPLDRLGAVAGEDPLAALDDVEGGHLAHLHLRQLGLWPSGNLRPGGVRVPR